MIFNEVYGDYYNTIAAILTEAADKAVTSKTVREIVEEKAFGESILTIPDAISAEGKWRLLDKEGKSILNDRPQMPLTKIQKRWLKGLLSDPRIKLFTPDSDGLDEVEPLFIPEMFVYYDQYLDGDPFEDEDYIRIFKTVLSALKEQKAIRICYHLKNGGQKWMTCNPYRLEYSLKDDKFRLISRTESRVTILNLARIAECQVKGYFKPVKITNAVFNKQEVELLLTDERQTLERVMLQFSNYEKITEKIDEKHYKFLLKYEKEDETELLIRILSFGPNLQVIGPESFIEQIKNRLEMQKSCGH